MAVDGKYGRVTLEHGNIGEDEPVVVFRARDPLLPKVLDYYHLFCMKAGSPKRHLDLIFAARERMLAWQRDNGSKLPDSEASRAWLPSDGRLLSAQNDWRAANEPQTDGSVPPSLPLYVHIGFDPVTTEWTKVSATTFDRSPLYTFSGDTPGQPPTGVSSEWRHYTGGVADHVLARPAATVPLEVPGLYEIRLLGGGTIMLQLRACRAQHALNRDDAQLLGAALQQAATPPADRPHARPPAGCRPPAGDDEPATDTKANLIALALGCGDVSPRAITDPLTWFPVTSRADAHRQLDATWDKFDEIFGGKRVGEPYMGGA